MSKIYAHKMVADLAVQMVQAAYEDIASDNDCYAMMPPRSEFVKQWAPRFVDAARQQLAAMLSNRMVSDSEKEQIFEALYLDRTLPRGPNVNIQ